MKRKIIFLPGLFTGEDEKLYKEIKNFFKKDNWIFFQYSDEKKTTEFSIKKTKEDLKEFYNNQKEKEKMIFIGHSMAGPVLSEFFIENNLENKLILLDPSVIPIPKHLHKDVWIEKEKRDYLIWEDENDLKEINQKFKLEYLEENKDYSKLNKKNILIFFSNLKMTKDYLGKEFEKTYSHLDIIEIKNTDHYFKDSEEEVLDNIRNFLDN